MDTRRTRARAAFFRAVAAAIAAAATAAATFAQRADASSSTGRRAGPSTPTARVTIDKPKARTETTGGCRILRDGTFSGTWGPSGLPTLAFTIGPGATMADAMRANKAAFTGPGRYPDEIIAVYLGKTALEDGYGGLGTIVIASDGHSGTFQTNDGKVSGRFDCGPTIQR